MISFYSRYICRVTPAEAYRMIDKNIIDLWAQAAKNNTQLPAPRQIGFDSVVRFFGEGMGQTRVPQRPIYHVTNVAGQSRLVLGNFDWLNHSVFFVDYDGKRIEHLFKVPEPA
ncbi:MAG: hypothetical protein WAO98_08240 [Alphaproteobacteria bacterium]